MHAQSSCRAVITDCDLGTFEIEKEELADVALVEVAQCRTEEEVIAAARDADVLLVQYAPISQKVIRALRRCRGIARYGIGVDMIDLEAASERRIPVFNVPDYCVEEVSDHTCALILALCRKIEFLNRSVRKGEWNVRLACPIHPLAGRVLGLLGFGKIGRRVAQKMRAFGVQLIACDPFLPSSSFESEGVRPVDLRRLLAESEILSLHLPLDPETEHILGQEELRSMKPHALLVNTSRGSLIDEKALCEALRDGYLAGAGLDVLEIEPIAANHPLLGLENVILTPHAAFYSDQSIERLKRQTARAMARLLKGESPTEEDAFALVNGEMLKRFRK